MTPQPGPPPPLPTPRWRLPLIVSIIAGALALCCVGSAVTAITIGGRSYRQHNRQSSAAMGQPVRDGNFQFTANHIRCGIQQIGTPDAYQTPTGQFCVIDLTIKNVGAAPASFADTIQKAFAPNGDRFSANSAAGFYANPNPMIFMSDVNPGNQIQARIVYDIPVGSRIARLELHENPFTRGAVIKIT